MQNRVKKTTKYLLTIIPFLLFIVASIIVLFLAQGRTLTDEGKLIESSILRVNSYPLNPTVFINGERVELTDGKTINITPGKNTIRLSKEGYYDWEKEVLNYAGIIKEIFVQLYPTNISFENSTTKAIDIATYSADRQYVYFVRKNTKTIDIYRIKVTRGIFEFTVNKTEELVASIPTIEISTSEFLISNFKVNNNNSHGLISFEIGEKLVPYLVNFSSKKNSNLNSLIGVDIDEIQLLNNTQSLLFKGGNITGEYNYVREVKYLISNTQSAKYFTRGNNILFTQNNLVYTYTEGVSKELTELNNLLNDSPISDFELVSVSLDENIFIYRNNNNLVWFDIENNYKTLLDKELELFKISDNNKFIIFKKGDNFVTFTFEKNIVDFKSYNVMVNEINLSEYNVADIQIINGDKGMIVFTKENTLVTMDFDGSNIREILPDFSFAQQEVLIVNNNEMYAIVNEITDNEANSTGKFVYKFNLESIAK